MEMSKDFLAQSGSQLFFLDGKSNTTKTQSQKKLQSILKTQCGSIGLHLGEDVESKVRQLLARTELKEIAETARVLVEISDNAQNSTLGSLNSALGGSKLDTKQLNKPSSLMASKINLSPRQKSISKISV